jgi:carbonic anhydrase
VTCSDPRCRPDQYFGSDFFGPVHKNAGGRATDDAIRSFNVLRSIVYLKAICVVHHTGMTFNSARSHHLAPSFIR